MITQWPSKHTREDLLQWRDSTINKWDNREQYLIAEPGRWDSGPDRSHTNRYFLAKAVKEEIENQKLVREIDGLPVTDTNAPPVRVLDAACGVGYGGLIMQPDFYRGLDVNEYIVEYANRFAVPWMEGDAGIIQHDLISGIPGQDNFFDLIVSFETIEHVNQEAGIKLIREVHRVLKPGGVWLVSNPLHGAKEALVSHFHVHERSFSELFTDIVRNNFKVESAWEQTTQEPELVKIDNYARTREESDKEKIYYVVIRARKPK